MTDAQVEAWLKYQRDPKVYALRVKREDADEAVREHRWGSTVAAMAVATERDGVRIARVTEVWEADHVDLFATVEQPKSEQIEAARRAGLT